MPTASVALLPVKQPVAVGTSLESFDEKSKPSSSING